MAISNYFSVSVLIVEKILAGKLQIKLIKILYNMFIMFNYETFDKVHIFSKLLKLYIG